MKSTFFPVSSDHEYVVSLMSSIEPLPEEGKLLTVFVTNLHYADCIYQVLGPAPAKSPESILEKLIAQHPEDERHLRVAHRLFELWEELKINKEERDAIVNELIGLESDE